MRLRTKQFFDEIQLSFVMRIGAVYFFLKLLFRFVEQFVHFDLTEDLALVCNKIWITLRAK